MEFFVGRRLAMLCAALVWTVTLLATSANTAIPLPAHSMLLATEEGNVRSESACMISPDPSGHASIPSTFTSIPDGGFQNCPALKSLWIGPSVTSIGASAFYHYQSACNLEWVDFSAASALAEIKNKAFFGCKLKRVHLPSSVVSLGKEVFAGAASLVAIGFSSDSALTEFPEAMCSGCSSLRHVDVPPNLQRIKRLAFFNAFHLTEVRIGEHTIVEDEALLLYGTFDSPGVLRYNLPPPGQPGYALRPLCGLRSHKPTNASASLRNAPRSPMFASLSSSDPIYWFMGALQMLAGGRSDLLLLSGAVKHRIAEGDVSLTCHLAAPERLARAATH